MFFGRGCSHVTIFAPEVDPDDSLWVSLIGGQRVQSGLPEGTARLWRAGAKAFPKLTGAGAWGDRSHKARRSDHNDGYAVDFMTRDKAYGDAMLKWLILHAVELGINYIIWWGHIYQSKTGFKKQIYSRALTMPHRDHLHVSRKRP